MTKIFLLQKSITDLRSPLRKIPYETSAATLRELLYEMVEKNERGENVETDLLLLLSFAAIKELVEEDELAEYVLQLVLNGFRAKEFRVSHFADRLNDCEKDENIKKAFYAYEKQDEKGFGFSIGYQLAVKAYERNLLSDKYLEYFFVDNSDGAVVLTDRREDNKDYLFNTSFAYPRFSICRPSPPPKAGNLRSLIPSPCKRRAC